MSHLQKNIEGLHEDIRNNLDSLEANIDNIEKVMTKRCIKNDDGKLEVSHDPSVDESSLESCDEIPSILQKKRLLKYIEENLTPIEELKKKTGEVFTPWDLVDEMMRTIPSEFWTNPNHKILEPGSGFGPFAIWAYYRLMVGLKVAFPNEEERRKHIVEKMLYMAELNGVNVDICKTIFSSNGLYRPNIYHGDFLELDPEQEWDISHFDLICGNPPYNKEKVSDSSEMPLYNEFIEKCIDNCRFLLFLIPSRWFIGGKGLDSFREMMLSRKDIKLIKHFENSQDVFGTGVNIMGGICYFLKDSLYNGLCKFNQNLIDLSKYDILLTNKNVYTIVDKIINFDNLSDIYISNSYFGIKTNFENFTDNDKLVKCYVSQQKGFIKFVDKKYIKKDYNFWKVITPKANGSNPKFGNIFIGKPNEIHSQSYISFKVKNEKEANYLMVYLKSNFANFMLSLKKISQDISEKTISWIPMISLDREWIDSDIYEHFGLTQEEIQEIEKTIVSKSTHTSKVKEKLPRVVKDPHLSKGQSAEQHEEELDDYEDDEENEEQYDEEGQDEEGEFDDQLVGKSKQEDEEQEQPVCLDTTSSVREYNATYNKFTETLCDVVYLFNTNDSKSDPMPIGYFTSTGKIKHFPEEFVQQFDRCVSHTNPESCGTNDKCKWTREKKPNPARCELDPKKYQNKPELHKYNSYYNKSRKQSEGGKNNRKSKRYQKLKISKQKSVVIKNNRKSKRNLK